VELLFHAPQTMSSAPQRFVPEKSATRRCGPPCHVLPFAPGSRPNRKLTADEVLSSWITSD